MGPRLIMQYAFPGGLSIAPAEHAGGIRPLGVLSPLDRQFPARWYPPLKAVPPPLHPFRSVSLDLAAGEQADFTIEPSGTRRHLIGTFGASHTVVVLFEEVDAELRTSPA